jgi:hypothetical protein
MCRFCNEFLRFICFRTLKSAVGCLGGVRRRPALECQTFGIFV